MPIISSPPSKWTASGDNIYRPDGRVGIGIANPLRRLHVASDNATADFLMQRGSDDSGGPDWDTWKSRGTVANPTTVLNSDILGNFIFRGYVEDSYDIATWFINDVNGSTATGSVPGRMTFGTTPEGSTSPVTRMRIYSDGGITVPDASGDPTGGSKGAGSINAKAVYDDNVLLTDHVFDHYFGNGTHKDNIVEKDKQVSDVRLGADDKPERYTKTIRQKLWEGTGVEVHNEEAAKVEELKRDGYELPTIDQMVQHMEAEHKLPCIDGREQWKVKGRPSTGQIITQLWEQLEHAHIYIKELHERVKKLEKPLV